MERCCSQYLDLRSLEEQILYPVSKVLQCLILEKRGIIPRCSGIDKILDIANLMKRGILVVRRSIEKRFEISLCNITCLKG